MNKTLYYLFEGGGEQHTFHASKWRNRAKSKAKYGEHVIHKYGGHVI